MNIFNWVQSKVNGREGGKKPSVVSANHHVLQEPRKEEFSDWPHALLEMGTFGNTIFKEDSLRREYPSWSQDIIDFTPEEVGQIQKELTKLLSHKPVSNGSELTQVETTNLTLDKFHNCPSSLEVDRTKCHTFYDKDGDLKLSTFVDSSKSKGVSVDHSKNAIRKRSVSFLLKKMFVCGRGSAPAPSLRDPLPESRLEKLLRAILHKKVYPQSSTPSLSLKKYLENRHTMKTGNGNEMQEKANDGCKWVKTDSEYIVLEI